MYLPANPSILVGSTDPFADTGFAVRESLSNRKKSVLFDETSTKANSRIEDLAETIDWTHAKQNLQKAFESLPKKKAEQVKLEYFKELLFAGNISKIVNDVKTLFKMKASSQIMKKLKSYFVSNSNRMQYENNQAMKAPIGSGVIESAIRRVVNLRLKSPGSFWKLDFAETMIYLRAQLLYGRWKHLKNNWAKSLVQVFKEIAVCPVS